MWQPLWARPNDNCQLWPKWQVPMCGAILIQTGNSDWQLPSGPCRGSESSVSMCNCQNGHNWQLPVWGQSGQDLLCIGLFHWKSAILSSAMVMTSLWRHTWDIGTYFSMYGKKRPLAILWLNLHVSEGFIFLSSQWEVNHPLELPWEDVLQKSLGKMRVR